MMTSNLMPVAVNNDAELVSGTLAGKLRSSRGTDPMSPWEWEQFWAIRDYLLPDPSGTGCESALKRDPA